MKETVRVVGMPALKLFVCCHKIAVILSCDWCVCVFMCVCVLASIHAWLYVCVYSINNYVRSFRYTPYCNRPLLVSSSVLFCLPTSAQGELLSASGHPRRDADPGPAGGEEAAAHPAECAARTRQGSGSAARATTEGQGQRDGRGSGSERRQKVRLRETTEGQGQRDGRRSGSER